ncbi:MAG: hypothetical protein JOS17DRAFT_73977 [Linnemannia elongata]|nr:MAG: hypothetical protein JOS17DRAFT_73977 [Linnemannia elongata]
MHAHQKTQNLASVCLVCRFVACMVSRMRTRIPPFANARHKPRKKPCFLFSYCYVGKNMIFCHLSYVSFPVCFCFPLLLSSVFLFPCASVTLFSAFFFSHTEPEQIWADVRCGTFCSKRQTFDDTAKSPFSVMYENHSRSRARVIANAFGLWTTRSRESKQTKPIGRVPYFATIDNCCGVINYGHLQQ